VVGDVVLVVESSTLEAGNGHDNMGLLLGQIAARIG
jgi:hypothetical protein